MKQKIIIIGAFHEIIELAEELNVEIVGLVDNVKLGTYREYNIILNDSDGSSLPDSYKPIPLIISPDSPLVRERLYLKYSNLDFNFYTLISPKANISKSAQIDDGVVVQSGVNVSAEAHIEPMVKLNTYANIMHNSIIGKFTTVAPNVVVLGNVKVGRRCYLGSNSTILPNIEICDDTTIGAGAVVTKNITEPGVYVGVPAVKIK
jgi:UDP-N-acetylbacillosamine N-acetyltransferase